MKEIVTAGPAYFAAATPVRTKMPVPMTQPMPSRMRSTAPSVLAMPEWAAVSRICSMLLVRNKFISYHSLFFFFLKIYNFTKLYYYK